MAKLLPPPLADQTPGLVATPSETTRDLDKVPGMVRTKGRVRVKTIRPVCPPKYPCPQSGCDKGFQSKLDVSLHLRHKHDWTREQTKARYPKISRQEPAEARVFPSLPTGSGTAVSATPEQIANEAVRLKGMKVSRSSKPPKSCRVCHKQFTRLRPRQQKCAVCEEWNRFRCKHCDKIYERQAAEKLCSVCLKEIQDAARNNPALAAVPDLLDLVGLPENRGLYIGTGETISGHGRSDRSEYDENRQDFENQQDQHDETYGKVPDDVGMSEFDALLERCAKDEPLSSSRAREIAYWFMTDKTTWVGKATGLLRETVQRMRADFAEIPRRDVEAYAERLRKTGAIPERTLPRIREMVARMCGRAALVTDS